VTNRFEQALANLDAGMIRHGDRTVIREALSSQIGVAFYLEHGEWLVGRESYPNWVGFAHLQRLVGCPGEQIHVHDLANQSNFENARKAVQKSIGRAAAALVDTQPAIGLHLTNHIHTGVSCCYSGEWIWKIAP
jgi:hypothetical protein